LWNNGSGVFATTASLITTKTQGAATGDLDGDGDMDLVLTSSDNQTDKIYLNNGNGTFADHQTITTNMSKEVELADLDGDGDLDIVFANGSNTPNTIWLNNGSGTFASSGQTLASRTSMDIALSDFNDDGAIDIFVANGDSQNNALWVSANTQNLSLLFDGNNDYLQTTTTTFDVTNQLTIEAWVNPTANNDFKNILVFGDYAWGLALNDNVCNGASGKNKLLYWTSGAACASQPQSTIAVPDNEWSHVAVVVDKSVGTTVFYINGNVAGTVTSATINSSTASLYVGVQGEGLIDNYFNGSMDEVRVWNTARTQAEIQGSMYLEQVSVPESLIAYYDFNQTSTTAALDRSGNKHASFVNFTNPADRLTSSYAVLGGVSTQTAQDITAAWVSVRSATSHILTISTTAIESATSSIVFGHFGGQGGTTTQSVSTSTVEKYTVSWYISEIGNVSGDVTFDITNLPAIWKNLPGERYALLKKNSANSDTYEPQASATSVEGNIITFANIALSEGYWSIWAGEGDCYTSNYWIDSYAEYNCVIP
jgi:hypothetical protein